MKEFFWKTLAWVVTRGRVRDWLIRRADANPYYNLEGYMERGWIFNPYSKNEQGEVIDARITWLPSIRVHHILRADADRHCHDHPWDARTIVLHNWYMEVRDLKPRPTFVGKNTECMYEITRRPGDTATLKFGEYHQITKVPPDGVWTLFFTWKYKGVWGFRVNGVKVPWHKYLKGDYSDSP